MTPQRVSKNKNRTIVARIPIASLTLLVTAVKDELDLQERAPTKELERALATAERAIKVAKLKRGIFT